VVIAVGVVGLLLAGALQSERPSALPAAPEPKVTEPRVEVDAPPSRAADSLDSHLFWADAAVDALARFSGDVVDDEGVPVIDAEVEFLAENDDGRIIGRTDRDGQFTLGVQPGEWTVRVKATGYLDLDDQRHLMAVSGTELTGLRLTMTPSTTLSGVVIDERGQPVVDAGVAVMSRRTFGDFAIRSISSEVRRTDTSGAFVLQISDRLKERAVAVRHDCCLDAWHPLSDDERRMDRVTIQLTSVELRKSVFSGVVVDRQDRPVGGAFVSVSSSISLDAGSLARSASAMTDERGAFSVQLQAQAASARAVVDGSSSELVELVAGSVGKLIVEPDEVTITGRVTDEAGQPVTNFRVEVQDEQGDLENAVEVLGADGRYRVSKLRTGPKRVELEASDFAPPPVRRVTLLPDDRSASVDFVLSRGRTLRGTVVDERTDAPLGAAFVSGHGRSTRTDAAGAFALKAVPRQAVDISIDREGYVRRSLTIPAELREPAKVSMKPALEDGGYAEEFDGIGALLDLRQEPDGGSVYSVDELHPQGGAKVAGLQVGDEIVSVEDTRAEAVSRSEFFSLVRGPEGSVVRLRIRRARREFDLAIVRRRVLWEDP
jgi:protocatechuate 3,4-dioxygenase beta subunit